MVGRSPRRRCSASSWTGSAGAMTARSGAANSCSGIIAGIGVSPAWRRWRCRAARVDPDAMPGETGSRFELSPDARTHNTPVAGLAPAIHVFPGNGVPLQDVDARDTPGQGGVGAFGFVEPRPIWEVLLSDLAAG